MEISWIEHIQMMKYRDINVIKGKDKSHLSSPHKFISPDVYGIFHCPQLLDTISILLFIILTILICNLHFSERRSLHFPSLGLDFISILLAENLFIEMTHSQVHGAREDPRL